MNKLFKVLFLIIIVLFVVLIIMPIFKLCPPEGPWPTPPWCVIHQENSELSPKDLSYISKTDLSFENKKFVFGIGMMDLWGRLCTTPFTCDNPMKDVKSSFKRLKQLGTKLVMVTDFYQIDRKLNFLQVTEGGARTISSKDMKFMIDEAHRNGLQFMLITNLYEKNKSREVLNTQNPNKNYIDSLFNKWREKILEQAKKGEYDYLVIDPRDIAFFFNNQQDNDYINEKLVNLIPEIRKVYSNNICLWGPKSWINNFGDNYDCLIIDEDIKSLFKGMPNNLESISSNWDTYLSSLNYSKPTFVLILMPSYNGALENGWIEPVGEKYGAEYKKDYKIQALVYEGFFRAVKKHPKIGGVISYGYWWNDQVYPNTLDIFRNDLSHSIRDKDAESVFYKWANNLNK